MNNYVILEKIGEGAYGAVYKAKCKATNEVVAIKKIRVEDGDEGIPATTIREVALLRELKHENIVRLIEVLMPPSKAVHLVFEYMTMDLRALLDSHAKKRPLDDAVVKKYLGQIVAAILFCHKRRFLRRDLQASQRACRRKRRPEGGRLRLFQGLYATSAQFNQQGGHPLVPCAGDALGCQ
ncbi:hypothetical protein MRX96_058523 [Rhipicephalus microplus]